MPAELQGQVITAVDEAKRRSEMPVATSLKHLGVPRASYFRWKKEERWREERSSSPSQAPSPVQAFEALPEEKQAVVDAASSLGSYLS